MIKKLLFILLLFGLTQPVFAEYYTVEVVRATRAERPSESVIQADSVNVRDGNVNEVIQDPLTDNYFIVEGNAEREAIRLLSTNPFNSYANKAGEGVRFIEYPHSKKLTFDWSQKSETYFDEESQQDVTVYPVWIIRQRGETSGENHAYGGENGNVNAQIQFGTLCTTHPSDELDVIYDWKGKTYVVMSRTGLWIEDKSTYRPIIGTKTLLNRQDSDRW